MSMEQAMADAEARSGPEPAAVAEFAGSVSEQEMMMREQAMADAMALEEEVPSPYPENDMLEPIQNRKRIEKLRRTLAAKAGNECVANSLHTGSSAAGVPRARVIAADMMGVGDNYVGLAKRIKDASPELFERLRAGELSLSAALDELNGVPDDPQVIRIKRDRNRLNRIFRSPDQAPPFLDRLEALLAEFASP